MFSYVQISAGALSFFMEQSQGKASDSSVKEIHQLQLFNSSILPYFLDE